MAMKIGAITCVLVALSLPALAQDSRSSLTVMREYIAADQVPNFVAVPDNLLSDLAYRALLQSMLDRSPTFRRQCLRLANDPRMTVHLHPGGTFWTRGARAVSRIVRKPDGAMDADIYLSKLDDDVELIAHELEHVIEQLDHIDLESRASLPETGVHHTLSKGSTFETARAAQVGLRVAREVRAADPKAN
jgi:hypothetical protein